MPKVECFLPVDAELQTIWTVLLDRIEHPERYMAGVESCDFKENTETYAVREILIQGVPLTERITIDEHQGMVRYELLNHPLFSGDVYHELIPPDSADPKAKPVVRFRMDWMPATQEAKALEATVQSELETSLRQAVQYVKDMAERLEQQQSPTRTPSS